MVLLMYWENDSEEKRKARREEKLRLKKLGLPPEPPRVDNGSVDRLLGVIDQQDKKLDQLNDLLAKQQELLHSLSKDINQRSVVIERSEVGPTKVEPKHKTIDDVDVKILDTEGIETVGETAGEITKGKNIISQIDKLKRLTRVKEDGDE
jgi:hypothetical protein